MIPALFTAMTRSALALGCLVLTAPAFAGDADGREWLQRMSQAIATRNYEGRFFHMSRVRSETMQIIHRVADGKVTERLLSLDGSGREIIRDDTQVICYLPDRRTVLVERRPGNKTLLAGLPTYSEDLARLYSIEMGRTTKVLGRSTQLIDVRPRDQFRYGYRLWLDSDSAMPLKTQLCDHDGNVIEQLVFAEFAVLDAIPAQSVKPSVAAEGFRWIRQDAAPAAPPSPALIHWRVLRLPSGFKLTVQQVQVLAGSVNPVQHLVFSDGLASVSVFIEPRPADEQMVGLSRMGSAFAFSRSLKGHQVTAVGEVPAATVEAIAESVLAEGADSNAVAGTPATRH